MPKPKPHVNFKPGDKVILRVCEPVDSDDASIKHPGNYLPRDYAGEVVMVVTKAPVLSIKVRWHLPASFGYKTKKGVVSNLVHIANGVWLEARKRPRNVTVTIELVEESTYQEMVELAARGQEEHEPH
jgi:hypothetical protein